MRSLLFAIAFLGSCIAGFCQPARSVERSPAPSGIIFGALRNVDDWRAYKANYVTRQGRVIDTGNGNISHSEGQGYGMILAVAADDRETFDRIWGWTRANLMVRDDNLFAWKWDPSTRPAISDINSASDGDILIAWALVEASEAWNDASFRLAARRIALDIRRTLVQSGAEGQLLLMPGAQGFTERERQDGPVVNLSYWVFPALTRFKLVAGEHDWDGLAASGLDLVRRMRLGPLELPPDWASLAGAPKPAQGFDPSFGYNAIRIPLYLALAGKTDADLYRPFAKAWRSDMAVIDIASGRASERMGEAGYHAIAQLTRCMAEPGAFRADTVALSGSRQTYYPATMQLLVAIARRMGDQSCAR